MVSIKKTLLTGRTYNNNRTATLSKAFLINTKVFCKVLIDMTISLWLYIPQVDKEVEKARF